MQLNFKKFGEGKPLIILHGLFGSLDNWQTIARNMAAMAEQSYHQLWCTYIIDQRNHGRSPHSHDFSYNLLAADLLEFIQQHHLPKVSLLGHSMGGKTAMKFAQLYPELLDKLIVVDITPAAYDDRHSEVFNAINSALNPSASSRKEIENRLREKLNDDEATIQFLLKNVDRDESGYRWKFNAASLAANYTAISSEVPMIRPVLRPTLFVKGEKSLYINSNNYGSITAMFPRHELIEIKNSAHWVHAEQPAHFTEAVLHFLCEGGVD